MKHSFYINRFIWLYIPNIEYLSFLKMNNYVDFEFNFTYHKAMKEKVPGVTGVGAGVPDINDSTVVS